MVQFTLFIVFLMNRIEMLADVSNSIADNFDPLSFRIKQHDALYLIDALNFLFQLNQCSMIAGMKSINSQFKDLYQPKTAVCYKDID